MALRSGRWERLLCLAYSFKYVSYCVLLPPHPLYSVPGRERVAPRVRRLLSGTGKAVTGGLREAALMAASFPPAIDRPRHRSRPRARGELPAMPPRSPGVPAALPPGVRRVTAHSCGAPGRPPSGGQKGHPEVLIRTRRALGLREHPPRHLVPLPRRPTNWPAPESATKRCLNAPKVFARSLFGSGPGPKPRPTCRIRVLLLMLLLPSSQGARDSGRRLIISQTEPANGYLREPRQPLGIRGRYRGGLFGGTTRLKDGRGLMHRGQSRCLVRPPSPRDPGMGMPTNNCTRCCRVCPALRERQQTVAGAQA